MLKVGDIVRHSDGTLGLIIDYRPAQETYLDSMFPYFVYFIDTLDGDWYRSACLKLVSRSS